MATKKEGLLMQKVMNATEVRKEWGSFIDNVVRFKPSVVKRNRDYMAAISLNHLDNILTPYRFALDYEREDDGSYSGSIRALDLVANAQSLEELKINLTQELIEYANEYMEEFETYYNAPNRQQHFPYVMRVLIQRNNKDIRGMIDA